MGKRILFKRNPNTEYHFTVRGRNILGETSAESDPPAILRTSEVPPLAPPQRVEAWPLPLMNMTMLFWSNARREQGRRDIQYYRVYRSTQSTWQSLTEDDVIAEVKGRMHFDYSKDYRGKATSGSTGSTLQCLSTAVLRDDMVGQKIWNMGTFISPLTNIYATITSVNTTTKTIVANVVGGWASGDRYVIDYVPLRNQLYYYWVTSVSQEGRESAFGDADGATLGRPNPAVIDTFAEDESEDFLWLKGWSMTFHTDGGAEGYYVKWRRTGSLFWSPPRYVRHEGEPDDPQYHVFKNKVVGVTYDFAVRAVNHLVFKDYMQEDLNDGDKGFTIETDTVEDASAPQPPTHFNIFQGPWNNWLSWTKSPSGDVKHYQIYRVEKTSGDPSPPSGNDLDKPYVRSWSSASSFFIDPLAGTLDFKNWWYWIRAVDWYDNPSTLAGPAKEEAVPTWVTLNPVIPTLFGNKVTWEPVEDAAYYKIYRSENPTDPSPQIIAWHWLVPTYIDILHFNNIGPRTFYYWVNVVSKSGIESLFKTGGEGGTPLLPHINNDTDPGSKLDESRVSIDYQSLAIYVKNRLDLIATSELSGEISSLSITPKNITLQSGGTINLTAGGAINLASDIGINLSDIGLIKGISAGTTLRYLKITPLGSAILALGESNLRWTTNSQYSINTFFDFTGSFHLRSTASAGSQIYMNLPSSSGAGPKQTYRLYRNTAGQVMAGVL